jgi:uncharacterized protein involved in tellurium resistance
MPLTPKSRESAGEIALVSNLSQCAKKSSTARLWATAQVDIHLIRLHLKQDGKQGL